jgi:hypothetical protein
MVTLAHHKKPHTQQLSKNWTRISEKNTVQVENEDLWRGSVPIIGWHTLS